MKERAKLRSKFAAKSAEQRLQTRVKLTCFMGALHTVVMAFFAYIYARVDAPWQLTAILAGALALLTVGVWFRMTAAGIGFVAIAALNVVLQAIDGRWSGVAIGAIFVLAYVDGMRSLLQLRKLEDAAAPAPADGGA